MHFLAIIQILSFLNVIPALNQNSNQFRFFNLLNQSSNSNLYRSAEYPLNPKFLSLWNWKNETLLFTFPRVQSCQVAPATNFHGSCLYPVTCVLFGGKPAGKCYFGLKTCCVPFINTRLPVYTISKNSFTSNPATYTVRRSSSSFCQVRLDFKTFDVGDVDQNGICDGGLIVTGEAETNSVPSVICGLNTGQHIYLNFDNDIPIMLTVNQSDVNNDDWNIKVTQIPCGDVEKRVPADCLQYFREPTGQVESFNFRTVSNIPIPSPTYQLSNLDYNICIESSNPIFTRINWTKGSGTTSYYFVLTSNSALVSPEIAGTVEAAVYNGNCTNSTSPSNDFVEIMNGQFTDYSGVQRTENLFCGVGFPSSVSSTSKPFKLHVVTNELEVPNEGSVGFSLSYTLS